MLVQHKTWAVFVLSSVVKNYKQGQDEAVSGNINNSNNNNNNNGNFKVT